MVPSGLTETDRLRDLWDAMIFDPSFFLPQL